MPGSSFDSLVRLPPRRRRRHKGYTRVTRKNYRPPLLPIQETDLYKMLAQPSVKTLETRLKECYHRLNKHKMAHHRSPRGSKRRPRRRSTRSKRRRRSTRSKRRRRSTRSKRPRRSSRRSKRSDPVARARARGRAAQRDREQKRIQQLLNRNW
jgi:hypothetical protein